MKLFKAIAATAAVITCCIANSIPAEARNGWTLAGHGDKSGYVYTKPIDRTGSIRRYLSWGGSSREQFEFKADCRNWNAISGDTVIPAMPGTVLDSELELVCR